MGAACTVPNKGGGKSASSAVHRRARPLMLKESQANKVGHFTKINTLVLVNPAPPSASANVLSVLPSTYAAAIGARWSLSGTASGNGNRVRITLELSMRQQALIEKCWREQIGRLHGDLFQRTMLSCIEASPRLNEVIARGRFCFRDLTKWPKLNRICQAQFVFFEKLIFVLHLNEQKLLEECTRLGDTHARYAQFGLKPHFLDIFQHQMLGIIQGKTFDAWESEKEREETVAAFAILLTFITEVMNHAYALRMAELRVSERAHSSSNADC